VETVQELVRLSGDARVLDIGCGDGSISLPLLTGKTSLTLLDLSAKMLSIAKYRGMHRLKSFHESSCVADQSALGPFQAFRIPSAGHYILRDPGDVWTSSVVSRGDIPIRRTASWNPQILVARIVI
jgi:SAM-dependent methyltransferase